MKTKLLRPTVVVAVASVLLSGLTVSAQVTGAAPGAMSAALFKLFGDNKAFTAKVEIQVLDGSQQEVASFPMDLALLDEKARMEIDLTKMKNKQMPAGMADALKQMGMGQVVNIRRPDKKLAYTVYPNVKAVLSQPLPTDLDPKLEKTELGKETVDGHPCVKNKNVITDADGKKTEATTWNATDLKDFPVQIQAKDDENTSILRFKQVQLTKPEDKLFDPPAEYTTYNDQAQFREAMMNKMTGGASQK